MGRAKEQFKTSKGKYVSPAPIEGKLASFNRVEAWMVTGSGYPQPFAIGMLPLGQWEVLKDSNLRSAFTHDLQAHFNAVNEQLDPHERLDCITIVSEQWTVEAGFVTPTLKLKRNVLEKYYGPRFDTWLAGKSAIVWHQG